MSTQGELGKLEAEIRQLEETIRGHAVATKQASRVSLGIALGLFVIMSIFVIVNYFRIKAEMTGEKLARSLEKELQELAPAAVSELNRLGQDLLPIYASEFSKQIQASWPDISDSLEREVNELAQNILGDVHGILGEAEKRVLERTEKILFESYPGLKDEVKQTDLHNRIHAVCEASIAKNIGMFDSLFSKDLKKLQDTVFSFDISDTHETTEQLQKRFIHLWLQLLDQEVMEL